MFIYINIWRILVRRLFIGNQYYVRTLPTKNCEYISFLFNICVSGIKLQQREQYRQSYLLKGSCLSPTLYQIYTNDMPLSEKVKSLLFADNTMLYINNRNAKRTTIQLQKHIE